MSVQIKTRLPFDMAEYLKLLPWWPRVRCAWWRVLADLFGFWKRPVRINPDPVNYPKGMLGPYWMYKARKPILLPEKGSRLDEYFASRSNSGVALLPDGFRLERRVTLSAVGDLMNAAGTENSKGVLYSGIADLIFDADISFANLESTLTTGEVIQDDWSADETPKINASPAQFDALKGHEGRHFTVLQTANNHILDCGMEGFDTTHDILEAEGILYVGTNRRPEDHERSLIVEKNGLKIGFVAATYGVNCKPYPGGRTWLVNHVRFHAGDAAVDLSLLERQIEWCRSAGCDFVVVALHWGPEHEMYPWPNQLDIAHSLAESGADAIIGHHAHNPHPYEIYRTRRDPDHVVPIFYGLGNISSIVAAPHNATSLVLNMTVAKGVYDGKSKTFIEGFSLTPVIQMEEGEEALQLRIHRLDKLLADATDPQTRAYLGQAAAYVDIALGPVWRQGAG
jgi:poly-gamma-glutamate synthesis protein (capsule biosynthesis protein)